MKTRYSKEIRGMFTHLKNIKVNWIIFFLTTELLWGNFYYLELKPMIFIILR